MKLEAWIDGEQREIEIDERDGRFTLEVGGRRIDGEVRRPEPGVYTFVVGSRVVEARVGRVAGSDAYRVEVGGRSADVRVVDRKHRLVGHDAGAEGQAALTAPMPGKVVAVLCAAGDAVTRGQGVLVVEAMKMQNEVKSPKDGVVVEVRAAVGDTVNAGQLLALVE